MSSPACADLENGELVYTLPTLSRKFPEYAKREMETFWDEYKRLHSPHPL